MVKGGKEFIVTPWEVSGDVDYDRIIKEFGVSKIDNKLLERLKKRTHDIHFMLRRKVFFAHRDLKFILDEFDKGNKFFLYTGRAPSGPVHLGHLLPWIFTKWLQDKFDVELWFQFPDEEKFLFKKDLDFKQVDHWTKENMLDIIALGFDPKKTHFIIDTKHADIMYRPACEIAKKITFSTVKASFGLTDQANLGSIFYTAMQAVPAILPSILRKRNLPCLIPHAIDQDPHFRVSRDVIPKLGFFKPGSIQCMFLPPLTGPQGKMSASSLEQHAIFTTDSPKEVENKIKKYAFSGGQPTLEEHRKKGGNPEIDVSFQYLRMLFEPDDKKLEKIYKDYKSGKMLTGELKQILIEKINAFLKEHQKKREQAKKQIDKFIYSE
jgi:tryptophanyl-tRNA synthetase